MPRVLREDDYRRGTEPQSDQSNESSFKSDAILFHLWARPFHQILCCFQRVPFLIWLGSAFALEASLRSSHQEGISAP